LLRGELVHNGLHVSFVSETKDGLGLRNLVQVTHEPLLVLDLIIGQISAILIELLLFLSLQLATIPE